MALTVAKVDRDYISEPGEENRIGTEWSINELRQYIEGCENATSSEVMEWSNVRFRLLDDDGEVYYGGWLLDDSGCTVQQLVLEWGKYDAGCTTIQIRVNNEWKQEIG